MNDMDEGERFNEMHAWHEESEMNEWSEMDHEAKGKYIDFFFHKQNFLYCEKLNNFTCN